MRAPMSNRPMTHLEKNTLQVCSSRHCNFAPISGYTRLCTSIEGLRSSTGWWSKNGIINQRLCSNTLAPPTATTPILLPAIATGVKRGCSDIRPGFVRINSGYGWVRTCTGTSKHIWQWFGVWIIIQRWYTRCTPLGRKRQFFVPGADSRGGGKRGSDPHTSRVMLGQPPRVTFFLRVKTSTFPSPTC